MQVDIKMQRMLSRTLIAGIGGLAGIWVLMEGAASSRTLEQRQFLYAHESSDPGATHSDHGTMHGEDHEHGTLEVAANQPVPAVTLIVHPDSRRGWNLEVQVENFRFAPEHVNAASTTTTEGHAHLYINGAKITRLYGNWYYLSDLPPGRHEITVSLNANGHEALTHNGRPIQSTVVLDVSGGNP
ncbi:MAG: hypothetical protein IGS50_04200 [Synechococcales cyanobacterium C42_A2020_086]|jgi:hypothetical protein|nr:hypothetical protein [Synechococcales cyanobacterium C42_A2020_086]